MNWGRAFKFPLVSILVRVIVFYLPYQFLILFCQITLGLIFCFCKLNPFISKSFPDVLCLFLWVSVFLYHSVSIFLCLSVSLHLLVSVLLCSSPYLWLLVFLSLALSFHLLLCVCLPLPLCLSLHLSPCVSLSLSISVLWVSITMGTPAGPRMTRVSVSLTSLCVSVTHHFLCASHSPSLCPLPHPAGHLHPETWPLWSSSLDGPAFLFISFLSATVCLPTMVAGPPLPEPVPLEILSYR